MSNSSRKRGSFRVGTSGYQYDHWRGVLYPHDEPKRRWFDLYSQQFDTVEINNTFYNLPKASTFEDWRQSAPGDFLFVLKYSQFGTHMKRLKDPRSHVDVFIERADRLEDHLGPILVQLPPNFHRDGDRLDSFLEAAPNRYRWAVEFRDESWLNDQIYDALRRHGAALCIHDMISDHPRVTTADWVYLRFHCGDDGDYPYQALVASAKKIECWLTDGLDVYAYFNNDMGGHAVRNAQALRRYVNS